MAKNSTFEKPASMSTSAGQLLDQLLAAISKPAGSNIPVVIDRVEATYAARSVSVEVRPASIIENDLNSSRKALVRAEIGDDADAATEAAARVDKLEKELSSREMKLAALGEVQEERREAVSIAHGGLGEAIIDHRQAIREAAKALEGEAKRLKAIAWAAQKVISTDVSLFDPYAGAVKSPAEQTAIEETRAAFPAIWQHAFATWQRVQNWLCRP